MAYIDDRAGGVAGIRTDGAGNRTGVEVRRPLTTVVIGRILSATLLVLPLLYWLVHRVILRSCILWKKRILRPPSAGVLLRETNREVASSPPFAH